MICINSSYLRWIVSGLLLGVGFSINELWFVGLVGAVLFIQQFIESPLSKQFFFGIILAAFTKFLFPMAKFWAVYPITFLPIDIGSIQILLIFIYWFTSALWLSAGILVLMVLKLVWVKFCQQIPQYYLLVPLVLAWPLAEIVGSWMFSVMMIGPGGYLTSAYSFGYSGYLLAEHNLFLGMARWGGVYLLSVLFITIAVGGWLLIRFRQPVYSAATLAVIVASASRSWWYADHQQDSQEFYEVAVVDTSFKSRGGEPGARFAQQEALRDAVTSALREQPQYVILPEGAEFFNSDSTTLENRTYVNQIATNTDAMIIDSRSTYQADNLVLESYIFESNTNDVTTVDKRYLVPQGEYMPYVYGQLFRLVGQGALVDYVADNLSYRVGNNTHQGRLTPDTPAILFCFESVNPQGVQMILQEHPQAPFVAHIVSHAWFNESEMFWDQLDTMLQVQAVWNQTYIVSSTNLGRSRAYTPQGSVLSMEEVATGTGWSVKTIQVPR